MLTYLLTYCFLQQSPLTPSGKCVRASSQRYSSATLREALTPTAVLACTTANTWSLWTWCPAVVRRREPGSQAWSTWWLASATRTVWPKGNAPVTNILHLYNRRLISIILYRVIVVWGQGHDGSNSNSNGNSCIRHCVSCGVSYRVVITNIPNSVSIPQYHLEAVDN